MTIKQQLAKLRKEWVKYPSRREVIEVVAKSLKKRLQEDEKLEADVRETLL